ncbi:MAG: radical SAM protein [Elusimicrobiota bacterium]
MKIVFVKPTMGRLAQGPYTDEGRMEPLQLGVLAALTPLEVEAELYDDRVEAIPYDEPADLAAITVEAFTARRAYEIAAGFRERGVPVVLGGMHPTLAPEEAARHADAVVVGDAEEVWRQVVEDARAGGLKPRYQGNPGVPQRGAMARRDLFKGKGYLPITLVQFGRGCRFHCAYCATSAYFGRRHHRRPVGEVLREIESQEGRLLFFVDDNLAADPEAAKELCRALIPLGVRWVSQASMDMAKDPELMRLMSESGCLGHVVGFESIEPESLRWMGKAPNLVSSKGYGEEIRVFRDHGLQLWAAFTLGHDYDTPDSIRRTLDFALRSRFTFAAFNILVPYPSTPLYRTLESEGRLLYDGRWWLHPEYRFGHAAFTPKNMSSEELTRAGQACRTGFNSLPSMLRRLLDPKTDIGIYLSYAPLFRREVFRKFGMFLGLEAKTI